ncbi:hypothetical protein EJ110_NYTH28599, partial [Nymphaea thermarum]
PINGKREKAAPPSLEKAAHSATQPYTRASSSSSSLHVKLCNSLDNLITNFVERHPLRLSVNPKDVLAGNNAPIDELPPTKCTVEGRLPSCLEGAYILIGLNLQFIPKGAYHPFDGDGMLHAIRISGGHATFCSRFVRTNRFNKEEEAGMPINRNFFAVEGTATFGMFVVFAVRVLTSQINPMNGVGLANTSLAFFNNKLMALEELDLPYVVQRYRDGWPVGLWREAEAEHDRSPQGVDGKKQPDVPIFSFRQPSFVHELAITERYAIIPDTQIAMKPLAIFTGLGALF